MPDKLNRKKSDQRLKYRSAWTKKPPCKLRKEMEIRSFKAQLFSFSFQFNRFLFRNLLQLCQRPVAVNGSIMKRFSFALTYPSDRKSHPSSGIFLLGPVVHYRKQPNERYIPWECLDWMWDKQHLLDLSVSRHEFIPARARTPSWEWHSVAMPRSLSFVTVL